jgi:spoIIIJ-associated protein
MDLDPRIKIALENYLKELFDVVGESAQVEIRSGEEEISIDFQGATVFAGEDQRALRSLGYLLEIFVRRTLGAEIRVQIDADGYRQSRREELRVMALQIAEEVMRERKRVRLNPMEPYERRAVHEALQDMPGVRTYSEGSAEERRVIIEPTDLTRAATKDEKESGPPKETSSNSNLQQRL